MLKGGSLFYALAITVIMALISASLLLVAHYGRIQVQRDKLREEVGRNSRSGLALLMGGQAHINYNSPEDIDLFNNGTDSVLLTTKLWGAFEIAIARAHNKFFSHELIAAVGWQNDANDNTALTLADLDRPLFITGKTKLTGDCYLPKAGIQRAYIEGQNYSGNKLVYGQEKISERFLPAYNEELVKQIKSFFEFIPAPSDSVMYAQEFQFADSISNSFLNRTLYIFSEGTIAVDSRISGQVCIISKSSIHVGKQSSLHNVLLIAPEIIIEDETTGDFQAFARDSLFVGENVTLHYPTVLGIIGSKESPGDASLLIGEKTKIFGQVFGCTTFTDFRKQVIIMLEKEAVVYGEIYCSGIVDHKGIVIGTVSCAKFRLKTSSAEYENHLMNAVIDRPKRSADYVASSLTRKKTDHKAIVQWLQ